MVLRTLEPQGDQAYDHAVVEVRRVSRTVKGGRRFRFRAAVLLGDKQGHVGFGIEKGRDVSAAITKAQAAARKHVVEIPRRGGSIAHQVRGAYRGAEVLLKPAPPGTGVIAGGPIRALAALAGIADLSSKSFRSRNKLNVMQAALRALASVKPA